jgi:hypothetical protein
MYLCFRGNIPPVLGRSLVSAESSPGILDTHKHLDQAHDQLHPNDGCTDTTSLSSEHPPTPGASRAASGKPKNHLILDVRNLGEALPPPGPRHTNVRHAVRVTDRVALTGLRRSGLPHHRTCGSASGGCV